MFQQELTPVVPACNVPRRSGGKNPPDSAPYWWLCFGAYWCILILGWMYVLFYYPLSSWQVYWVRNAENG